MPSKMHPEDFIVEEPLVLINVGRSIGGDLSSKYPADVYAAVHGYWDRNLSDFGPGYLVLARNKDRVLGAFRVKRWIPSPGGSKRWGFVGEPAELDVQMKYVGKRVPDRYRSRHPVRYVTPEDGEA